MAFGRFVKGSPAAASTPTATAKSSNHNQDQNINTPAVVASPPQSPSKPRQSQSLPQPQSPPSVLRRLQGSKSRSPFLSQSTKARNDQGIITLRYEETSAATRPPVAVTVAPPRSPPVEQHPAFRSPPVRRGSGSVFRRSSGKASSAAVEDKKRDSGVAPATEAGSLSKGAGSVGAIEEEEEKQGVTGKQGSKGKDTSTQGLAINFGRMSTTTEQSQVVEQKAVEGDGKWKFSGSPSSRKNSLPKTPNNRDESNEEFTPITTPIPMDNLMEDGFMDGLSFSNRGSVMFGGKKAINKPNVQARANVGRRQPSVSMLVSPTINVLPEDVELESQKVRSMYEHASLGWEDGSSTPNQSNAGNMLATETRNGTNGHLSPHPAWADRPGSAFSTRSEHRKEFELAGGIEDWRDVRGGDVDRYGFISMRRDPSRPGTPEPRPPQRVSTVLQLASETPRQKRTFGRSPSTATSHRNAPTKEPSRKVSARSLKTQGSAASQRSSRASLRAAANRLPGNRDRRCLDEAGDMLTLPPGLADIAEDEEGGKAAAAMKRKEFERTEKWRKMAKVVKTGKEGEGMHFEFDTKNPKLIERTWKGIPDRWRSEAWFSFLRTSARKRADSPTEEEIIIAFHKLVNTSSADDTQIDIDVPRTINSHIMFRRRYRGGQRLLFRVLHCLALYYPNTGYVQGMASLAATLLCYFDEEKCFIMLVRMWSLRGLDKLYEPGFPGLMACLDEFQKAWLDNNPAVAAQLLELGIDTTAYGTRWYLTLFNYSIPFAAQLRVWDVFMLLGDPDPTVPVTDDRPFQGGWDVLHATAAALIDGTREILLDSDFENAMKVLTSWIPVKDEELLMKVAGAEYRGRRKRAR